jgi:Na+-transporting methylmalonyl-CoA/oxaloacetate decarboxylase gamma subunit
LHGVLIAAAVIFVIASLLIFFIRHIKKKIRNKVIDTGANIITKTAKNFVDEKTANKINEVTNITAEIVKSGKPGLITAAKKVLKITEEKKNDNHTLQGEKP